MQHVFDGLKYNCESSSSTIDGTPENSSDLEQAAAARSIANKFSGVPSIDQKLQRCENMGFHFHSLHLLGPGEGPHLLIAE